MPDTETIVSVVLVHPRLAKYWFCWQIQQRPWKIAMFFPPRALRICDGAPLSSRASILPLIMTSQEIRIKQVNYVFWNMATLVHNQQPLESVHVDTQHM